MSAVEGKQVPEAYTAIFESATQGHDVSDISYSTFSLVGAAAQLPRSAVGKVWKAVNKSGEPTIHKNQFMRALALIAIFQKTNTVDPDKIAQWPELPVPDVGEISSMSQRAARSSVYLGNTWRELEEHDYIQVAVSKRAGVVLKHTNYSILSKRRGTTCIRRYSDFEPFDAALRKRFPFRIIPALPPKSRDNSKPEFIEHRRRALQRYLTFVNRHPDIRDDPLVEFFMTDTRADFQHRMKDKVKQVVDEFETHPDAAHAGDMVPEDILNRFAAMDAELDATLVIFDKLRSCVEELANLTSRQATLWKIVGDNLKGATQYLHGDLAGSDMEDNVIRGVRQASSSLSDVVERSKEQRFRQDDGMVNSICMMAEVLEGFKGLLDRRSKLVTKSIVSSSKKQSKDMRKLSRLESKPSDATSAEQSAKLHSKMAERGAVMDRLALQNSFSLLCIWNEAKLVRLHLSQLPYVVHDLIATEALGHSQLEKAWAAMRIAAASMVAILEEEDEQEQ